MAKYHAGNINEVVLHDPSYIRWALSVPEPRGWLIKFCEAAEECIEVFDTRPFLKQCQGKDCSETATRGFVYRGSISPLTWWCDDCSPAQAGCNEDSLIEVREYLDVFSACSTKRELASLVKRLAEAKGFPSRSTQMAVHRFFNLEWGPSFFEFSCPHDREFVYVSLFDSMAG